MLSQPARDELIKLEKLTRVDATGRLFSVRSASLLLRVSPWLIFRARVALGLKPTVVVDGIEYMSQRAVAAIGRWVAIQPASETWERDDHAGNDDDGDDQQQQG